jgi:hypothetical protein
VDRALDLVASRARFDRTLHRITKRGGFDGSDAAK